MRLIDADELWKKMYSYSDNEGAKMPYGDDDSLIHKDSACFLIENAPTIEPEQRWIPCSERPPEESGEYLVCDEYKNILKKWYWTAIPGWKAHEGRIIAWMPLPESYKERREE